MADASSIENGPTMSSPPSAPTEHTDVTNPQQPEQDDTEMADTEVDTTSKPHQDDSKLQEPQSQSQSVPQHPTMTQRNRKDATLHEILSKMDDYAPIVSPPLSLKSPHADRYQIPDAVTAHYLTLAGLPPPSAADPTGATTNTTPLPLARLLALATQKFISDIAADAYQYSRSRQSNSASANNPLGPGGMMGGTAGPGAGGGAAQAGGAGSKGTAGAQQAQLGIQRSGFGGGGQGGSGQGRTVLTMEDLGMAVADYGVNVRRAEFYR